jgi:predicted nucleotide-binding protein
MDAAEREDWVTRLKDFLDELKRYRDTLERLGVVRTFGLDLATAGPRRADIDGMRERLLRASATIKLMTDRYGARVNLRPPFSNYVVRDYDVFAGALSTATPPSGSIMLDLEKAVDLVNITIGQLESAKPSEAETVTMVPKRDSPKAFVAHGPSSEALNKLCELLEALGVKPLVVERLPSEGRSINENVEHYLGQADCGIVLATADDLVDGRYQPRGNVNIEIGRFQERFGGKVVFLLEEDAAFPTNVEEKVWERFSQSSMDKAFLKLVRELRAFGLL